MKFRILDTQIQNKSVIIVNRIYKLVAEVVESHLQDDIEVTVT